MHATYRDGHLHVHVLPVPLEVRVVVHLFSLPHACTCMWIWIYRPTSVPTYYESRVVQINPRRQSSPQVNNPPQPTNQPKKTRAHALYIKQNLPPPSNTNSRRARPGAPPRPGPPCVCSRPCPHPEGRRPSRSSSCAWGGRPDLWVYVSGWMHSD